MYHIRMYLVSAGRRTFRPWTHTSDDSYMYQLSLVVEISAVSRCSDSYCFLNPIIIVTLFLSLVVVTQIWGRIAGSSPSPLRFVPSIFIARRFQLFLPSSTCVELCLPTLGALSNFSKKNIYPHYPPRWTQAMHL